MHIFKLVAIAAAALLSAASAGATDYKFAHTYSSGSVVSGEFSGYRIGNIVTATALKAPISITGPGLTRTVYLYTHAFEHLDSTGRREAGGARFSFDGLDNNFIFTNLPVGSPSIYDEDFLFSGLGNRQNSTLSVFARSVNSDRLMSGIYDYATGSDIPAHWVLSVPEPETYALMLAGLGVMGAVVRRRKASQA